jgi:hypothetical protein
MFQNSILMRLKLSRNCFGPSDYRPRIREGTSRIFGFEPLFPSVARLGEAFAVAAMAQAAGIAAIWKEMTGSGQDLSIDIRQAAHGISPEATFHPTINGHTYPNWVGTRIKCGANITMLQPAGFLHEASRAVLLR